jgi:hypothetical protein
VISMSGLVKKAVVVVGLGLAALAQPSRVNAATRFDPFCVHCVAGTGCGLEEALCQAWGCGTPGWAYCGQMGTCTGDNYLITCNERAS